MNFEQRIFDRKDCSSSISSSTIVDPILIREPAAAGVSGASDRRGTPSGNYVLLTGQHNASLKDRHSIMKLNALSVDFYSMLLKSSSMMTMRPCAMCRFPHGASASPLPSKGQTKSAKLSNLAHRSSSQASRLNPRPEATSNC